MSVKARFHGLPVSRPLGVGHDVSLENRFHRRGLSKSRSGLADRGTAQSRNREEIKYHLHFWHRPQIGVLCQKIGDLRFNGLGQHRTRAAAQDLCERIGEDPLAGNG